jgi:hypothetical protein
MEFLINDENSEAVTAEEWSVGTENLYDINNSKVEKVFANFHNPI